MAEPAQRGRAAPLQTLGRSAAFMISREFYSHALYPGKAEEAKPINDLQSSRVMRAILVVCRRWPAYDAPHSPRTQPPSATMHWPVM